MGMGCNCNRGSLFEGYETFWIIVVIAVVVIWAHYLCGCGRNCGCGNFDDCCTQNCNTCC